MKDNLKILALSIFITIFFSNKIFGQKMIGTKFDFEFNDKQFKNPYIDVDKEIEKPIKCRYIHGGFDDGTLFSFYLPSKDNYKGRFFQYITPFPDSETAAQNYPDDINPIIFSIDHGAYFVETNEGGKVDFSSLSQQKDASIGAYRANAACAEFSRHVAKLVYKSSRPYGYCFGGSGGAYRTVGGMENTENIWDGAVPFVMGSPQAIPNVFAVRMFALRILKDKLDDIVDALEPGGSGNPYANLTTEQSQVLQECTRMGFPIRSWYGWRNMDSHGFLVLYRSLVEMDAAYFRNDFWNVPGYLGYDNPKSLQRDRVKITGIVSSIIGEQEAVTMGLSRPLSDSERGTADRAWASMGSDVKYRPVAYRLNIPVKDIGFGGELIPLSGKGKGQKIQISKSHGYAVVIASVNKPEILSMLQVGDSVMLDNSDFLAAQSYYRHQVPTEDYYVWDQFRGINGIPIYPQRSFLVGPIFTKGAAGSLPEGKIKGKVILLCSLWDREAFAWQGDWYKRKVTKNLGAVGADQNFRLWYTDRALHGDNEGDDAVQSVSYMPTLFQALLDVSAWAENGTPPSQTSKYEVKDGQVILNKDGSCRGGIQPVITINSQGKDRVQALPGESITIQVSAEVPQGTGRIVRAEWCLDNSKKYTKVQDLKKATWSKDGQKVSFETEIKYNNAGTYFPTVRVYSERNGNIKNKFTSIPNLAKIRVNVKNDCK